MNDTLLPRQHKYVFVNHLKLNPEHFTDKFNINMISLEQYHHSEASIPKKKLSSIHQSSEISPMDLIARKNGSQKMKLLLKSIKMTPLISDHRYRKEIGDHLRRQHSESKQNRDYSKTPFTLDRCKSNKKNEKKSRRSIKTEAFTTQVHLNMSKELPRYRKSKFPHRTIKYRSISQLTQVSSYGLHHSRSSPHHTPILQQHTSPKAEQQSNYEHSKFHHIRVIPDYIKFQKEAVKKGEIRLQQIVKDKMYSRYPVYKNGWETQL